MNDKTTNHEPGMRAIDEMQMNPEWKLRKMLADLRREYQARTAPIIKALADYEALRPSPRFFVPMLPDDHPLMASVREAAERAMSDFVETGTGAYKLVVNPAMPKGEALFIGANVVRVVNMHESPERDEQHSCAKSLDNRKSQQ